MEHPSMKKLPFPLSIIAVILTGCGGKPVQPAVDQLILTDPEKSLEVTAGDEFRIIIGSNPTTGYHWELIGNPDDTLFRFVSKYYQPDEPVLDGSGGSDIWTFKALAAGEAKIVLGNYPPGQGEPAIQEVTFTVIIK
ncbi:hypothetical protein EG834_11510 [bacterium]|nr:hypothetical protein [bacterium]